jgi:tetratricopeptide (TPR) repeat protein
VLWVTDPERPSRFFRAPYTAEDDKRLRAAAREAAQRCAADDVRRGGGPPAEAEAVRCARNRLLKRGAILHTDAAMHIEDAAAPAGAGAKSRSDRWRIRFADGKQHAAEGAHGHWELARSLLENVTPDPEADDTVRLWYMFPQDPHVLFLAGCLHETFASPMIQSLTRSIDVMGARPGISSEKSELREAEELFRRALKADPALVEARIRRGRVLHLLGKPEEAVLELRQAVSTLLSDEGRKAAPDSALMLYFAEMFFGAAAEALGQADRARASYARAAELFPGAPSPNLALSQLALRANNRGAALAAVERALPPAGGDRESADPWWRYHSIQGRDAAGWFERLHESLQD